MPFRSVFRYETVACRVRPKAEKRPDGKDRRPLDAGDGKMLTPLKKRLYRLWIIYRFPTP